MDELTEQEKQAKRLLSRATFWRRCLFWMSFPIGIALSYAFQPSWFQHQLDILTYMFASWMYMAFVIISIFTGDTGKGHGSSGYGYSISHDDLMHIGIVALVTTLVVVVIFWIIGRIFLQNAKSVISLTLSKEKALEITERVEQGLLYMKKDSDTFAGSVKRKIKQFLLGTAIICGALLAFFLVLCLIIWIMR